MSKSGNAERAIVIVVALAVVALSVVISAGVRTYRVPTAAMNPTIPVGSHVIALVTTEEAARGEIFAFRYPLQPQTQFMKRIVAVGGDEVQIVDKKLFVNGKPLAEPYVVHEDSQVYPLQPALPEPYRSRDQFGPFRVPPGEYFFLGDNRDRSADSRYWGTVPRANLIARAAYVFTWRGGFRKL